MLVPRNADLEHINPAAELVDIVYRPESGSPIPEDPSPTQEVWVSPHQQCVVEHVNGCIVNANPTLLGAGMRHAQFRGRNTDVPEGYRFSPAADPSPFVYCKAEYLGCKFEFQWIDGQFGYAAENVTLYPDTVYLIKLVYSMNAACSQPGNCNVDQLSVGSQVFLNDSRTRLNNQPVPSRVGQNLEAVWAVRLPDGNYYTESVIQVFLQVQWAVFANPANFTIHRIEVIAQPSDYRGYIYTLSNA